MVLIGLEMEVDTEITKSVLDVEVFVVQDSIVFDLIKKTGFVRGFEVTA